MSDDQFTKLFTYMQQEFSKVHERLDQTVTKAEFNVFINAVDAFAKRMESYDHERLALSHQVDRHDGWIHQLAKSSGTKLAT